MNKFKLIILLLCLTCTVTSNAQTAMTRAQLITYASSLKGKKKAELKTAIYNLCHPKTLLTYGGTDTGGSNKTWSGFIKTDRIGTTLECRNRYSTKRFYFTSESQTNAPDGMNIEHSFPKSWWGGTNVDANKDLYNLYPSDEDGNSLKANYPMGKVSGTSTDYEKVGTGDGLSFTVCEPNDEWKGDFCRSYFYMATIYQDYTWQGTQGLQELENDTWPTLQKWAYTLYLDWAGNDRVTDIEVDRNNAVYAIQGNRNLFIDFPILAEYVWGDSIDVAFDPTTSLTSTAEDNARFAVYQAGNYPSGLTAIATAPTLTTSASFTTDSYDVTITNNESGATVYYTTDGTTPTTSSSSFNGTSTTVNITATTTIKAMAVVDGKSNSSVASATYTKTEAGKSASSVMFVLHTSVGQPFNGFTFSNAEGLTGTYKSSDESVATVNASTGAVTIVDAGSATITYTVGGTDAYNEASMSYGIVVE